MFKLGDPWWLNLIWGSMALFFVAWFWEGSRRKALRKAFGKKVDFLTDSLSLKKRTWHLLLQCACLGFFAFALARPLIGSQLQEVKQTGIEMIIAADVSNSMMAEDDKPSRLEHAKHEINHLMDESTGDHVGLIAFAGSAILISPMTSDHSAIKLFVNSLSTDSVSTQGTNFKDVIDETIRAFDKGGVEGLNGAKPTRVLIIASDGEDNEPGGLTEVQKAVDQGIRVFTLGFGSEKGAPIPIYDDHGNSIGYKKDKAGQVVMSVPSPQGLSKIAAVGGGKFYQSTFGESELHTLLQDLGQLQKTDFKTRMATDFEEKFQIPLFLALFIALIEILFGERKIKLKWKGRFEVSSGIALFLCLQFSSLQAHAFGPPAVSANKNGIKHYNDKDYINAFKDFARALGKDPHNPTLHFNLGDAFLKNNEPDKAIEEYESAEKDPKSTPDIKFNSMFNAGNASLQAKNIPKALEYYQRALEYHPDSREVKTNIELALKEQQGGGGGSENKDDKQKDQKPKDDKEQQKKSDKGDDKRDQPQKSEEKPSEAKNNGEQENKAQPKPFKSQNLNENDVRRILEELKRQEEEVRARQYKNNHDVPEQQIEKDW